MQICISFFALELKERCLRNEYICVSPASELPKFPPRCSHPYIIPKQVFTPSPAFLAHYLSTQMPSHYAVIDLAHVADTEYIHFSVNAQLTFLTPNDLDSKFALRKKLCPCVEFEMELQACGEPKARFNGCNVTRPLSVEFFGCFAWVHSI